MNSIDITRSAAMPETHSSSQQDLLRQAILDSRASSSSTLVNSSMVPAKPSLWRLSSLESILQYKEAVLQEKIGPSNHVYQTGPEDGSTHSSTRPIFRSTFAEVAFCFSMALTQLLAEYMISGFSVILPTLLTKFSDQNPSDFWPASVLSLILCSTIVPFARVSDMYGGYPVFMFAVFWLCVWSVVAGFGTSLVLLDVCRAMQGLAIAAYTPSSFALFGCIYPAGPRRNVVLGIYSACAPLGFFAGICISAVLGPRNWSWYFWIAAALAMLALVAAYVSVPSDQTDRSSLNLTMDWSGAFTIVAGLILVAYALAASSSIPHAWTSAAVLVPLILGLACLACAIYIEYRWAKCPLLPLGFFSPPSVAPLTLACIFFYGSFGTWLFTTTSHLRIAYGVTGLQLAAWFAPMAAGGFFFATVGSSVLHILSPTMVLCMSGAAWVAAPLLLALGSPSAGYWPFVFPSMLCATLGIDVTFTVASVVLSSSSPLRWQGLAGAVNSTTVNLGIAFSLAIAQIIQSGAEHGSTEGSAVLLGHRNAYLFAAASAAVGLAVTVVAVRIPRGVVSEGGGEGEGDDGASQSSGEA